jgi:hypothetical protein
MVFREIPWGVLLLHLIQSRQEFLESTKPSLYNAPLAHLIQIHPDPLSPTDEQRLIEVRP